MGLLRQKQQTMMETSPQLIESLQAAREMALETDAAEVLPAHLVLAMMEDDEASFLLEAYSLDFDKTRADLARQIVKQQSPKTPDRHGVFSQAIELMLEHAREQAHKNGLAEVDSNLMLAVMLSEPGNALTDIFAPYELELSGVLQYLELREGKTVTIDPLAAPPPALAKAMQAPQKPANTRQPALKSMKTPEPTAPPAPPKPVAPVVVPLPANGPAPQAQSAAPVAAPAERQAPAIKARPIPPAAPPAGTSTPGEPDKIQQFVNNLMEPERSPAAAPQQAAPAQTPNRPAKRLRTRAPRQRNRTTPETAPASLGTHESLSATGSVLEKGRLVENIPRNMRMGQPVRAEVRITREQMNEINSEFEMLSDSHVHDLAVTEAMTVQLRAPAGGFHIENLSPQTQWIDRNQRHIDDADFGAWRWNIEPTKPGKARLQLVISARTVDDEGNIHIADVPDKIIPLSINQDYGRTLRKVGVMTGIAVLGLVIGHFGMSAYQWLVSLAGAVG